VDRNQTISDHRLASLMESHSQLPQVDMLRRMMEEGSLMAAPRMALEDRRAYILNVLMTKVRVSGSMVRAS
jgi:hypothetical protein